MWRRCVGRSKPLGRFQSVRLSADNNLPYVFERMDFSWRNEKYRNKPVGSLLLQIKGIFVFTAFSAIFFSPFRCPDLIITSLQISCFVSTFVDEYSRGHYDVMSIWPREINAQEEIANNLADVGRRSIRFRFRPCQCCTISIQFFS